MKMQIVIDGKDGMLGRIAAYAAKQALLGKEVIIVNCNEILVTGRKNLILEKYKIMRAKGGTAQKGPFFPRSPERVTKRTVRGMLPYKKGMGLAAFKRVMCYNTVPAEFEKADKIEMKREVKVKAVTLKKVSELM